MTTDKGRKRKSFLEKHFHIPEKKEITFQDFADQLIIPPMQPSISVIQKKWENEMKEKEQKSLTDEVKDIAGRVDKLEGKTEEKISVRKFEQAMIKKSVEILNMDGLIGKGNIDIIASTVQLIGFTFGMAGFEQYHDEYLAEQNKSEESTLEN